MLIYQATTDISFKEKIEVSKALDMNFSNQVLVERVISVGAVLKAVREVATASKELVKKPLETAGGTVCFSRLFGC